LCWVVSLIVQQTALTLWEKIVCSLHGFQR
jgi:hypothetical protein